VTTTETDAVPWWRDRLLLATAAVFCAWALLALTWPLSGDAGVFAWMGDTVRRGGAPYRDAWDTKGPAAWLPSLLVQVLTGRNSWAIRVFDIAMVVAALVAMRRIARRIGQPGAGRIAIALYALWYAGLDFWNSAQPDGWVASWLIVASALVITGSPIGVLCAGALVGLAALVKPFYLGYAVVMWGIVVSSQSQPVSKRVGNSALVGAGIAGSMALLLLFLKQRGGLDAYVEGQRWNSVVYAGLSDPWLTRIPMMFNKMLLMPWGIVGPIALFGAIRPTRAHRRTIAALSVGFLGAVAGVILQGKWWQYHWLPMLPFLALLADIGFNALRRETAGEIAGRFRWLALALALTVAVLAPLQQLYRWTRSRGSEERLASYERREFRFYGRYPGSLDAILDSLTRDVSESKEMFVWGMHLGPQYLRGMRVRSRFSVIRPLFDGAGSEFRARYRSAFERELTSAPPYWWLLPTRALMDAEEELRAHDIESYSEAAAILHQRYRLTGQTAEWLIYERLPRPVAP
jgi:hypothetical protein